MSKTSVSKFVGLTAIRIGSLASENLKFPDARDVPVNIQKFETKAGMPGVLGCIDGSHNPIRGLGENDVEFLKTRARISSWILNWRQWVSLS